MRFKNLTITLTLTCLSIVALAGLVILPISKGICQGQSYGLSDQHRDGSGIRGWDMSGYVSADANRAKASASPSLTGKDHFTESTTWGGWANTSAYAAACWQLEYSPWLIYPVRRNYPEVKPDPDNGDLKVEVQVAKTAIMNATVRKKSDPKSSVGFGLPIPASVVEGVAIGGQFEWGGTTYIYLGAGIVYNLYLRVESTTDRECVAASVFYSSKKATVSSFWFGTKTVPVTVTSGRRDYPDCTAVYNPPPPPSSNPGGTP